MLAVTLGLVLQSTPVTFESPGIRLVNLIPALSKSVGVPMRVAKHMENDVVAIRTASSFGAIRGAMPGLAGLSDLNYC